MQNLTKSGLVFIGVLFVFQTAGQAILQPAHGFSNVTVASGKTYSYFDDGGSTANYSAGASSVLTIFPSKEGEFVSITCNSFAINSDCRMYIFDGSHSGAAILGYFNIRSADHKNQFHPGDVITASSENASGALTIRFSNARHRETMAGWDLSVSCKTTPGPAPSQTTQDCSGAIKVCSDSAITTKASGAGYQELPGPGFWNVILNFGKDGENQSNWYKFEVATAGTITFLIKPHSHTDFDWALWGPYKGHECPAWTNDKPYRLSACDGNTSQKTGLSTKVTDVYEDSDGDGFVAALNVKAGEHYVIMIDDWSGNHSTFDLSWSFSNGASLECKKDEEPPVIIPPPPLDTVQVIDLCVNEMSITHKIVPETSGNLGEIVVTLEGGTAPFTYEWKDASGNAIGKTTSIHGVSGGQHYELEIIDKEGCKLMANFEVIQESEYVEIDEGPKLEAEISTDQSFVTVSYPGKFEYKIENINDETVITGHAENSDEVEITKLPPGTYRVSLIYKKIKQYVTFEKN